MSTDLAVNPRGIAVTANAAKRILSVMAQEPPGSMLRVSVAGGGCSGFQYIFDVDREKTADDLVIERDGATVLIDETSLDLLEGIVSLDSALGHTAESRAWYVKHLEHEPSLVAAAKWLATEKLEHEEFHPQVQRALDQAAKPLTRYRCAACGFEARQHFWQCPGCQTWDSYPARRVEEL